MNKVHVIVNPYSARGRTEERWHTIKEVMRHYFSDFRYVFTEKPYQATEIARELLHDGFDLIIGVGGDGTINEITNGFFRHDSGKVINEDAAMAIIPSGTGSDFIRYLKVPRDFHKSISAIKASVPRKIDVGKVTFSCPRTGNDATQTQESTPTGKYFINVADFGLGAEVIKRLAAVPSGKRGPLAYYMGLLSVILKYGSREVRIDLDDKQQIQGRFLLGAVANGRIFGGGMIIAPQAEPDDGFFDLVLIDAMSPLSIIYNSRYLYNGKILQHPKTSLYRARKIKVTPLNSQNENDTSPLINIEYDGEMGQALPAEFEIIEKCINFRN